MRRTAFTPRRTRRCCSRSQNGPEAAAAVAAALCSVHYPPRVTIIDENDTEARGIFARLGFTLSRRESNYVIPTDPQVTGLYVGQPDGIVIISAVDACEGEMRLLDDALRQDVPGTGVALGSGRLPRGDL